MNVKTASENLGTSQLVVPPALKRANKVNNNANKGKVLNAPNVRTNLLPQSAIQNLLAKANAAPKAKGGKRMMKTRRSKKTKRTKHTKKQKRSRRR